MNKHGHAAEIRCPVEVALRQTYFKVEVYKKCASIYILRGWSDFFFWPGGWSDLATRPPKGTHGKSGHIIGCHPRNYPQTERILQPSSGYNGAYTRNDPLLAPILPLCGALTAWRKIRSPPEESLCSAGSLEPFLFILKSSKIWKKILDVENGLFYRRVKSQRMTWYSDVHKNDKIWKFLNCV
jgi:hypothetical protein